MLSSNRRPESFLDRWVARPTAIWWIALAYFAAYVPFTALTKAVSSGMLPLQTEGVPGAAVLPLATVSSLGVTWLFLALTGWWRYARLVPVRGFQVPVPTPWVALSGLCSAAILASATLAYTFSGVSIVFMMLLMRGGVLVIAPMVDAITGRRTHLASWGGLALSLAALLVVFLGRVGTTLTLVALLDVAVYLGAYFLRLRIMSRLAKSDDPDVTKRYFAEEQLVVTPATLLLLAFFAWVNHGPFMADVRNGFVADFDAPVLLTIALVGVSSQLVGIFGTLIFLDRRENTFSVPVNRSVSVLSGVAGSLGLVLFAGAPIPSGYELAGAALVIAAIGVLAIRPPNRSPVKLEAGPLPGTTAPPLGVKT